MVLYYIYSYHSQYEKEKLIFTVGEGTSASRMLYNDSKFDDLIDQFKRIVLFRWWLLNK